MPDHRPGLRHHRAARRARAGRVADPRGRQRRHGRARRARVLVRRARRSDAAFIRDAGAASLARGETFYTQNFGIPPLRDAIAVVREPRCTVRPAPDNIAVTASGMSALMLAVEALVAPGDRVVVVTPLWPNLVEIPKILSAQRRMRARSHARAGEWRSTSTGCSPRSRPDTRAAAVNSPNNPTGWTLDARASSRRSSTTAARHGIWLVADDVYERLYYRDDDARRAVVPRSRRARRARGQHQQLLQVVAHDRMAPRLDRGAGAAHARPGQAHRVQHVVLAVVRAARGRGRDHAGRADGRAHARAVPPRARLSSSARSRSCPASRSRRPRARCTRSSASTD